MYRVATFAWIPTILLFPTLNWIARGGGGFGEGGFVWYATILVLFTSWAIPGWAWSESSRPFHILSYSSIFSLAASVMLLLPGHAPTPDSIATVQSLLSVSVIVPQAIAPALGTAAFALAVNHPNFLNGYAFWAATFVLGGFLSLLLSLVSCLLSLYRHMIY
jgi:hypothetical protein